MDNHYVPNLTIGPMVAQSCVNTIAALLMSRLMVKLSRPYRARLCRRWREHVLSRKPPDMLTARFTVD